MAAPSLTSFDGLLKKSCESGRERRRPFIRRLSLTASRVLAAIVYQASPRDPVVLTGVVAAMALLGLLGTWIPAQRALSVTPLMLLREE